MNNLYTAWKFILQYTTARIDYIFSNKDGTTRKQYTVTQAAIANRSMIVIARKKEDLPVGSGATDIETHLYFVCSPIPRVGESEKRARQTTGRKERERERETVVLSFKEKRGESQFAPSRFKKSR